MQDKSTRFTLAATGILLAALILLGWILSRTAASKKRDTPPPAAVGPVSSPPVAPLPVPGLEGLPPAMPLNDKGEPLAAYQVITDTALVEDAANDGDTFLIKTPDGAKRFTLYYADAVETDGGEPGTAREIAEYFRFDSEEPLRKLGAEARDFSLRLMKNTTFRVVTRWEPVPNDDAFYAFIFLKDSEQGLVDLSQWLVRYGLAMIRPTDRENPDGTSASEYLKRLREEETRSQSEALGAWSGL